ncbi:DUF1120 domain-containing protein [Pseudomonas sp. NPDC098747]|uniref:DUF1120 domain-containing protein n=1 Tax=Pseudomonas sp. NPDC098747 TaxID=3364487 RepID=UPI00383B4AF1
MQINQPMLDFGTFNSGQLLSKTKNSDGVSLGRRTVQLSVTCPAPTRLAITFHGMTVGPTAFNLSDLGAFTMDFKNARLDGTEVLLGRVSTAEEVPASVQNTIRLMPNSYVVPVSGGRLGTGKLFTVTVEIEALAKSETRKIRDITVMQGEGQFEVITSSPSAAQGAL